MAVSGNHPGGGGFAIGAGNMVSGAGAPAVGPGSSITFVHNYGAAPPPTPMPIPMNVSVAPRVATPAEVFFSYSGADHPLVEPIIARLRELVGTLWIDDDLAPGEPFDRRIDAQVNSCRAQIVAWSPRSVE